nr:hypothetical protein CFP56_31034 [Quercus suber]
MKAARYVPIWWVVDTASIYLTLRTMASLMQVRLCYSPLPWCLREPSSTKRERKMLNSLKSKLGSRRDRKEQSPSSMTNNSGNAYPSSNFSSPTWRLEARTVNKPVVNSSDAPPAYTAAPNTSPLSPISSSNHTAPAGPPADDQYSVLSTFDTVFLIDDSSSMTWQNERGVSRWSETADALASITPICTAHDEDGIDIHFLNTKAHDSHFGITSPAAVHQIFQAVQPRGGTPIGWKLDSILRPYLRAYKIQPDSTKPLNIICITDGKAGDDPESVLIDTAKELDRLGAPSFQVGVQFFQVGDDRDAGDYLRGLDDDLRAIAGNVELRDIVDTVPFTSEAGSRLTSDGILKVVLGAVNRRLDRQNEAENCGHSEDIVTALPHSVSGYHQRVSHESTKSRIIASRMTTTTTMTTASKQASRPPLPHERPLRHLGRFPSTVATVARPHARQVSASSVPANANSGRARRDGRVTKQSCSASTSLVLQLRLVWRSFDEFILDTPVDVGYRPSCRPIAPSQNPLLRGGRSHDATPRHFTPHLHPIFCVELPPPSSGRKTPDTSLACARLCSPGPASSLLLNRSPSHQPRRRYRLRSGCLTACLRCLSSKRLPRCGSGSSPTQR